MLPKITVEFVEESSIDMVFKLKKNKKTYKHSIN